MTKQYTGEINAQIIISLLKQHGIKRVVASPGTTNMAFVASVQQDPWFNVISSVDERSAAYIACGMAAESGEPVVISCTGATASRNYLSGLTEAYYRKLPILALTSTQRVAKVGHHIAQVIDRSSIQHDVAKLSVTLHTVKDAEDQWDCEIKANQAILELKRHGGGPVHVNLETGYSRDYAVEKLPVFRKIDRVTSANSYPKIVGSKIAIFIGSHRSFTAEETELIERFCASKNAAVLCDHTSGYKGQYRLQIPILAAQSNSNLKAFQPDLIIHLGEVSGDYYSLNVLKSEVWRVSEDGEIRDTFKRLRYVFEMPLVSFFERYCETGEASTNSFWSACQAKCDDLRNRLPEMPLSNLWVASRLHDKIPEDSILHFGILNSLRAWNFFQVSKSITTACNVGGFGIDGGMSSLFGAAQIDNQKLCFLVIGDLAFFYDMNVLGNRHLRANIRILLVNNGKGVEFRQHGHLAESFGDSADKFISAGGHFGQKSPELVKNYSENLGFEYLSASSKEEFNLVYERFVTPEITDKPMLFEVFTDSDDESKALELMMNIEQDAGVRTKQSVQNLGRKVLGKSGIKVTKRILGK